MNWKTKYVVTDQDEDTKLVVQQADDGRFTWEGYDYMAWKPKETWGTGIEDTLEAAQKAAEYWLTTGRYA